jgi:hypothetical protein
MPVGDPRWVTRGLAECDPILLSGLFRTIVRRLVDLNFQLLLALLLMQGIKHPLLMNRLCLAVT